MLNSVQIFDVNFSIEYLKNTEIEVILNEIPSCAMKGKTDVERKKAIKSERDKLLKRDKIDIKEGGE